MSASQETTPVADSAIDRPTQGPSKVVLRASRATVTPNSDARPSNKPTKADIIKNSQSNIKSSEAAKKWLTDHDYIIPGEDLSTSALTMALFYIANGRINTPSQLVNGIRAVALCLDDIGTDKTNPGLAKDIAEATAAELAAETSAIIANLAENAIKSIEAVESRCKDALMEARTQREAQELLAPNNSNAAPPTQPTYADMLKTARGSTTSDDRTHRAVVAKEEMIRKQILVDGIEGVQNGTEGLTPKLLVAKANLAIDLMSNLDPDATGDKPINAKIVSAKVLSNKGVVFETADENTAKWLRDEKRAIAFAAGIGSQASLKPRTFNIAVEFVPTSINDQLPNLLRILENDNDLRSNSLITARWMRAPNNWREEQKSAHAIITTHDLSTANNILKKGLIVEGSRLQTRKLEEEPRRCFKCQKFSTTHTAADCSEITHWCPNCAKPHSVDECRVKNRSEYACIGCRSKGIPDQHAAWDKKCPSYVGEKAKILERHPEYQYKFYLTSESWTWERKHDNKNSTEKWTGNTYEGRRTDPLWKNNAARRNDNGWGQRIGTGTLGNVPIRTTQRALPRTRTHTPSQNQAPTQPRPAASSSQSQPQPQPQPIPRPTTSAQTPSQSSRPPQPSQGARSASRGTASRTRGRSTSARRIAEHQPREPSSGPGLQTTLTDWFENFEKERIQEGEKYWANDQTPANTQP